MIKKLWTRICWYSRKLLNFIFNIMEYEIVKRVSNYSLIDENGNDLKVDSGMEIKYCVRVKGHVKPLKCFLTLDEAKEYLNELIEAAKPKPYQKFKP